MMFWPSMMSLEPPPVTPSRKFPPRLGAPAAPVAEPVLGVEELEPHAAASPPTAARPAPPMRSCRRETSVIVVPLPSAAPDGAPRGSASILADKRPGRCPHGGGGGRCESAGGTRPAAHGCVPAPE